MPRRVFVPALSPQTSIDAEQAHHLRSVLRLSVGDPIELFDAIGNEAHATLSHLDKHRAQATLAGSITQRSPLALTLAVAMPNGERADWLIEKLSELNVAVLQPIACERSVAEPGGAKRERWHRLAIEAARQSRRAGVLTIEPPRPLIDALRPDSIVCITETAAPSLMTLRASHVIIGPQGGWSESERELFSTRSLALASLGETILRIETAAIAAAVVCGCRIS